MSKLKFLVLIFLSQSIYGQTYSGLILNSETGLPIEYVNIGVFGKNIGTVSDNNGKYTLTIDPHFDNDTLLISCIGFYPFKVKVSDYRSLQNHNIKLKDRIFEMDEIVILPTKFKYKTLGVTTKSKLALSGFKDKQLGYECGVLMKLKKPATLEKLNLNIADCSYDTIFYRINVYKIIGQLEFENILQSPIYMKIPKSKLEGTFVFDLEPYNLILNDDFLVTIEHIKDLGPGYLLFCSKFFENTYYRKTSQGKWETAPIGISMSMDVKFEK